MIKLDYIDSSRRGRLVCEESIFEMVRNHFSEANPTASFANKKLKMQGSRKRIPERDYAVHKNGSFDFGLYNEIRKYLIANNFNDVVMSESFKAQLKCGFPFYVFHNELLLTLRDYQEDCVSSCLKVGRGTILVGTGGGKSLIQASLLENWKRHRGSLNALLIVPGIGLVSQLLKDFEDYGVKFTYSGWTGDMPKQNTEVVIVNTELLCSQFAEFPELLDVDLVLGDECHKIKKSNQITKLINKIRTPNKFGFTGTLPLENIEKWKVLGTFGPVVYKKKADELREEDYLTDVRVLSLKINHPRQVKGYKKEIEDMVSNNDRHNVIKKMTNGMKKNVLILVNRIEHGLNLLETLDFDNRKVFFIHGEVPVEERARIIDIMENNDDVITIAMSSIFSTGINIKNLHYIIFAAGSKSFTRVVQSIGRGLRLHASKSLLYVFDIYDNYEFSIKHHDERLRYYEMEGIKNTEKEITL
jgi:superfamily II DNA or RNA helicase